MITWKQKLEELGMTESELSKGIKKKIADYNTIYGAVKEVSESLKNAEEDETEELESQLSELKEGLTEANDDLVRSIETYHKNKDAYKAKVERMNAGRKSKAPTTAAAAEPTPAAAPTPAAESKPAETVQAKVIDEGEKKKGNALFWILGAAAAVIVGVVTLGRRAE